GIKGRMEAGETVTQEEVDREYGELAKGAPKEAQPLIVQAGKALWQVMSHKRRAGQQGQQGAGKPGQPLSKSPATDAQADAGASASGEASQTPTAHAASPVARRSIGPSAEAAAVYAERAEED